MASSIFALARQALMLKNPSAKISATKNLYQNHQQNRLNFSKTNNISGAAQVGRPDKPKLVDFTSLPKRSLSAAGLIHTTHAIAHIEFNAINIALDAIYRFQQMPKKYYSNWLEVANEEAEHFSLLTDFLTSLGYQYGDFAAHNGLWQMCINTQDSVLSRMALVPRVLEARGLDVAPSIREKFVSFSSTDSRFLPMLAILDRIFSDEINHVRIGNYWFNYLCAEQNLDPITTFDKLIKSHIGNKLRGNFNLKARRQAGFSPAEINYLQQ